jgi:predicted amidophosphoribosyltransferase
MDRREDDLPTELCAVCGEEVDRMELSSHAVVRGRTICTQCARRLGGVYDPESEVWSKAPVLPSALEPRKD